MDDAQKYFIDYVLSFYGKGGLYPIESLTVEEIKKAVKIRKKIKPKFEFAGDSIDREMVRDIILAKRNNVANENITFQI